MLQRIVNGVQHRIERWPVVDGLSLRVHHRIAPRDTMLIPGWRSQYFGVGADALRNILLSQRRAGVDEPRRILDLPCGHGRVLRFLKTKFPNAELTACDLDYDGVDFCAQTFGAIPVYSKSNIADVQINGQFDLIWVGSLFTHFDGPQWRPFLRFFAEHLAENGLLLFTTAGRYTEKMLLEGVPNYGIGPADTQKLLEDYAKTGFGYAHYPTQLDDPYGLSLSSMAWVLNLLTDFPQLKIVSVSEFGWAEHQDVYACIKRDFPSPNPWNRR